MSDQLPWSDTHPDTGSFAVLRDYPGVLRRAVHVGPTGPFLKAGFLEIPLLWKSPSIADFVSASTGVRRGGLVGPPMFHNTLVVGSSSTSSTTQSPTTGESGRVEFGLAEPPVIPCYAGPTRLYMAGPLDPSCSKILDKFSGAIGERQVSRVGRWKAVANAHPALARTLLSRGAANNGQVLKHHLISGAGSFHRHGPSKAWV